MVKKSEAATAAKSRPVTVISSVEVIDRDGRAAQVACDEMEESNGCLLLISRDRVVASFAEGFWARATARFVEVHPARGKPGAKAGAKPKAFLSGLR